MNAFRRFLSERGGAAALEFALIGPPFILLLFGLVEFGRGLHIRNGVNAAADHAQRMIVIEPSTSADLLENEARSRFLAGQPDRLAVSVTSESVSGVEYRLVSLEYSMQLLLPAPLGRTITVGSTRRVALLGG